MTPLIVLVPSRARPDNVARLVSAWQQTAAGGLAHLVVLVDDDDVELPVYQALTLPAWVTLVVQPRMELGTIINTAAQRYAPHCHAIGFWGDDHQPRTNGWDARICQVVHDNPLAIVYGNDLIHGANLPTAVVMDAHIVNVLGYMVPPGIRRLWFDNYWLELGNRLGTRHYLADVIIEHMHPIAGKAEWDDGYKKGNSQAVWAHDEAVYHRHRDTAMDDDVRRLNLARQHPSWT